MSLPPEALLQSARLSWEANQLDRAYEQAWAAYAAAPDNLGVTAFLCRLLRLCPEAITADRGPDLAALMANRHVDPGAISAAGWRYLMQFSDLLSDARDPPTTAARLEANAFARDLLAQDPVTIYVAEAALTGLRRWLLLSDQWRAFPLTIEAMGRQAALNEGAWLFDDGERARLDQLGPAAIGRAYRPEMPPAFTSGKTDDPVTRAVAEQYEAWPYPQWIRATAAESTTLAADIRKLDPDGPDAGPQAARILVAGCGTGRQAALAALRYPGAEITAIDLSQASLRYAAERCEAIGVSNIRFKALDLHRVGELGQRFDAILCTGVLHHLPDPERGWAALADGLAPGGVMQVMVYSKMARLSVRALRAAIADLEPRVVDADLLREVRRRILERNPAAAPTSRDFYSLSGVHDLLLHRHEDPFDVPRIQRALDRMGLRLIGFKLPTPPDTARYRQENPQDPLHRDFAAWSGLERRNPRLFAGMYDFWCRKPITQV